MLSKRARFDPPSIPRCIQKQLAIAFHLYNPLPGENRRRHIPSHTHKSTAASVAADHLRAPHPPSEQQTRAQLGTRVTTRLGHRTERRRKSERCIESRAALRVFSSYLIPRRARASPAERLHEAGAVCVYRGYEILDAMAMTMREKKTFFLAWIYIQLLGLMQLYCSACVLGRRGIDTGVGCRAVLLCKS